MGKNEKLREESTILKEKYLNIVKDSEKQYAKDWTETLAKDLEEIGVYDWIKENVLLNSEDKPLKILEIGTGDGRLTEKLFNRKNKILSIEYNENCLEYAKVRLDEKGIPYSVYGKRVLSVDLISEKKFIFKSTYKFDEKIKIEQPNVTLVLCDFFEFIKKFNDYIDNDFDIVIFSNPGSDNGRALDTNIYNLLDINKNYDSYDDFIKGNTAMSNLYSRNKAFKMAESFLKKQGIFYFIERIHSIDNAILLTKSLTGYDLMAQYLSTMKRKNYITKEFDFELKNASEDKLGYVNYNEITGKNGLLLIEYQKP